MRLDREELAWAAGFFDGEGHIRVSPCGNGNYRGMRVAIPQIHKGVLGRFRRAVDVGYVRGPFKKQRRQDIWWFRCCSFEEVQHLVAILWTWLSRPKRQQAAQVMRKMRSYHRAITALAKD